MKSKNIKLSSEIINEIADTFRNQENIKLGDILKAMERRGFGILIFIFNLPNLVPIPGITAIFSVPVIFISFQMMLGFKSPWLPVWVREKNVSYNTLQAAITKVNSYLTKVEKHIKPRFNFINERSGERLVGFLCLISAITYALPVPFANLLPVMSVLIVSLGFFNKDGLVVTLGGITAILGVAFTVIVALTGLHAAYALIHSFIS